MCSVLSARVTSTTMHTHSVRIMFVRILFVSHNIECATLSNRGSTIHLTCTTTLYPIYGVVNERKKNRGGTEVMIGSVWN